MIQSLLQRIDIGLLTLGAIIVSLVNGVLAEARDRVGRRLADWLFPDGGPLTYRLGRLVLALATRVAPRSEIRFELGPLFFPGASTPFARRFHPELRSRRLEPDDLAAAAAELEFDEQGEQRAQPVRLVTPLLVRAACDRLGNCRARFAFLLWFLFVRPLAVVAIFGFCLVVLVVDVGSTPFVIVYEGLGRKATSALVRSAIRRLPADMEEEEREFWTEAMYADAEGGRHRILTRRFAVDVWLRRRPRFPDRASLGWPGLPTGKRAARMTERSRGGAG